jgi:hypothetical protein
MKPAKLDQIFAALRTAEFELTQTHGSGAATHIRIARATHSAQSGVLDGLEELRDQGRAHIVAWTMTNPIAPVFASGSGVDAPKPAPRTRAQMLAAGVRNTCWDRRPDEPVTIEGQQRAETYAFIERTSRTPQTWYSALESL